MIQTAETDNATPVRRWNRTRWLLCLVAAIGALLVGKHVYLDEYLTTDENSYIFQAWLFAQGKLRLDAPPVKEAFFHKMLICDDEAGWLSRYPPAHSAWLIPGVVIGMPRLMTALAAFISLWFLTKAGERLKVPVWLSGALLLIGPYFWLMQGSVLSHTSGLAATAVMMWAYLVWRQDDRRACAAIAGLAWAFLFLNRTYTALWIALPFAVDSLVRLARSRTRKALLGTTAFAGCAGLGIVGYLLYNGIVTGDPFMATYLVYDPMDTIGFGPRHSVQYTVDHTPAVGWGYVTDNLATLNVRLWGFPGSLVAWLILAAIGWRRGITPVLLATTVLVWIAYAAFWFAGISWVAPIYYYETLVFIVLSAGMGLSRLFAADWRVPRWAPRVAAGCLAAATAASAVVTFRAGAAEIIERHELKRAYQQVIRDVPPGSVVLLSRLPKDILAETCWNPHGLDSDPLILRNVHGVMHLTESLFPGRPVYMVKGSSPAPAKRLEKPDGTSWEFLAGRLYADTGVRTPNPAKGRRRLAEAPTHGEGLLGFGVYQYVMPGNYEATFFLTAEGPEGTKVGQVEVAADSGKQIVAQRDLHAGDNPVTLRFTAPKIQILEPRVHFSGHGRLDFDRVELRRIGGDSEEHTPRRGAP